VITVRIARSEPHAITVASVGPKKEGSSGAPCLGRLLRGELNGCITDSLSCPVPRTWNIVQVPTLLVQSRSFLEAQTLREPPQVRVGLSGPLSDFTRTGCLRFLLQE